MTFTLDGIPLKVVEYKIQSKAKVSTKKVPYKSGHYYSLLGIYNDEITISLVCDSQTLSKLKKRIIDRNVYTLVDYWRTRNVKIKSFSYTRTNIPDFYTVTLVLVSV